MNNPEIWTIKMADHPQDDFVRLSAYKALDLQMAELMVENARLKAEVERLRASSFVTAVPVEQYERVIKAGDAMAREICILGPVDDKEKKAINDWSAAKEGKPSV